MIPKHLAPDAIEWLGRPVQWPRDFVRGTWRGVTAVNRITRDEIGVSIDTAEGTQRFLLRLSDARAIAELILEYLALNDQEMRASSQSTSESGRSSVDVSTLDDGRCV